MSVLNTRNAWGRNPSSIPSRRIRPVVRSTRKGPTSTSVTANRMKYTQTLTFFDCSSGGARIIQCAAIKTNKPKGAGVRSKKTFCSRLILVTFLIFCASSLFAQSGSTSALTGRITDATGAVLPGVTVTATSLGTNQTRTVLAAEDGVYRIPLLEPGPYKVRFS